jgi:hypothetical protein
MFACCIKVWPKAPLFMTTVVQSLDLGIGQRHGQAEFERGEAVEVGAENLIRGTSLGALKPVRVHLISRPRFPASLNAHFSKCEIILQFSRHGSLRFIPLEE